MHSTLSAALAAATLALALPAHAQITFYQDEGFRGPVFSTNKAVENFARLGFNDRASSVIVDRGRWEVCQDAGFRGHCVVLRPGNYERLSVMGLNDRLSSVRPVNDRRQYDNEAPPPPPVAPVYEYRRRPNERLFEVNVTSVHAVLGPPEQRCWVEREPQRDQPNVGHAVIGAILGGVIGHQIGGGTGRDLATAGGAVAGGVVGANIGRENGGGGEVRRCQNVANETPAYWDVAYTFRGTPHQVQMSTPPGPTITVNRDGTPRM